MVGVGDYPLSVGLLNLLLVEARAKSSPLGLVSQ